MGRATPASSSRPDNDRMNTPIPLLVFAGSTRAQSWNRKLAGAVSTIAAAQGAQVTRLELGEFDVPLYNADLEAQGTPRDVVRLKEIFHAHPAWIVCSPEYNGSYTALLKNTIDWVSSPIKGDPVWGSGSKAFAGKVVGLAAASPGALGGLRSLSHLAPLLMNLQCWVSPRQFALSRAAEAFDPDGQLATDASRTAVHAVVEQVLWAARRFHG
jgi:chromate reductase, NAD(P)H dehydrogenase (quinone)